MPASLAVTVTPAAPDGSRGVTTTVAPGRIAPVMSTTVTIARASRGVCAADGCVAPRNEDDEEV